MGESTLTIMPGILTEVIFYSSAGLYMSALGMRR
jgi:hypothetical protein